MRDMQALLRERYNKLDADSLSDIQSYRDDFYGFAKYVETIKPNPATFDYPGDAGDGYFTGYNLYVKYVVCEVLRHIFNLMFKSFPTDAELDTMYNKVTSTDCDLCKCFDIMDEDDYNIKCWEIREKEGWYY